MNISKALVAQRLLIPVFAFVMTNALPVLAQRTTQPAIQSTDMTLQAQPAGNTEVSLPPAVVGLGYSAQLSLDGIELATPISVEVTELPAGLGFNTQSLTISGVPAAANAIQAYTVTITIRDANSKSVTVSGKLALSAAKTIDISASSETELPDAIEGQPYQLTINLPVGATVAPAGLQNFPRGLTVSAATITGVPANDLVDGEYHGQLAIVTSGAAQNARLAIRLHLAGPVVKLAAQCGAGASMAPIVTSTITDLTTTLSGTASTGCHAKIAVWTTDPVTTGKVKLDYLGRHPTSAQLMEAHANTVQVKSGAEVASDGTFSVQLSSPPRAGQTLVLQEVFSDSSQNVVATVFSVPIPVHFAGDWGRVKTYFTSGILLSQDQGSFSQSSLFLSFLLDKTWVLPRPVYAKSHWVPGLSTFFETRLTSVPVTACPTDSTTSGGQCKTQTGSDVFNTFLTSQKTARLAVGAYLPFVTKVWTYNGVRNGLFLAPLAKIGFDTPTSPINQSQAQAQSTSAGNTSSNAIAAVNNASFYNFYVYGARLGHVALPAPEKARDSDAWGVSEAPELNSYLDVTVGRFSNLETLLNNGNHRRLYRLSFEGIMKVPSTPLVLGFSANLGQTNVGVNSSEIRKKAGDDLRFLIGARFDVGKITTYLTTHAF